MSPQRLTVTAKIALSYLAIASTSLTAVVYAASSLHSQTEEISRIVDVDFKVAAFARELHANLLLQEALERDYARLGDAESLARCLARRRELEQLWTAFASIAPAGTLQRLGPLVGRLHEHLLMQDPLTQDAMSEPVARVSQASLSTIRNQLMVGFEEVSSKRRTEIDAALMSFSRRSGNAFRWTLILVIGGLVIGGPIALSVAVSIHRSVVRLQIATKRIGSGRFDVDLQPETKDELGDLAHEFEDMGKKLARRAEDQLDANPLTHLPGNLAIDRELALRIRRDRPFAHTYVDLDHFKAYNDRYGYQKGSDAIVDVGKLIESVVRRLGNGSDMVGHIGGDDYVILTDPDTAEPIAQKIVESFDENVDTFYSTEDRELGGHEGVDRFGTVRQFPLMTISVAVVRSDNFDSPTPLSISRECARIKDLLKGLPGSNYLIDRRQA